MKRIALAATLATLVALSASSVLAGVRSSQPDQLGQGQGAAHALAGYRSVHGPLMDSPVCGMRSQSIADAVRADAAVVGMAGKVNVRTGTDSQAPSATALLSGLAQAR